jgi:hypothetical protein
MHPLRKSAAQLLTIYTRLQKLEPQLPAFLNGEVQPKDNTERILVAQLCTYKQHFRAAVRFYQAAFSAEPIPASSLSLHRFDAARAAAASAAGKGNDPSTEESERSRLRRQALDWLQAELSLWRKVAENGNAPLTVHQKLNRWKCHADLASVRDTDALERLPEAERAAWRQFWADVDTVLRKAGMK